MIISTDCNNCVLMTKHNYSFSHHYIKISQNLIDWWINLYLIDISNERWFHYSIIIIYYYKFHRQNFVYFCKSYKTNAYLKLQTLLIRRNKDESIYHHITVFCNLMRIHIYSAFFLSYSYIFHRIYSWLSIIIDGNRACIRPIERHWLSEFAWQ